jgi:membrane-associated phospholipid phosphatase
MQKNSLTSYWKPALVALLVTVACLIGFQWFDLPVARWMHTHAPKGSWPYQVAVNISGFGRGHFYIVPSLICAWVWWRRRNLARVRASLMVTATWAASGLSGLWFKHIFGRCRPSQYFTANEYGFRWFEADRPHTSFPSGHTTDVFAAAALLWVMFPRWRPVWAAWALLMALARVVSQNHYPTDTIAAAALGVAVAWSVRAGFVRQGWYDITPSGVKDPRSS